ncbi:FHS family L-fucose permease-like MFS transporter [Sphaerotilus hippei]|uniref:FHS family L-fucose permease-like MFS transporter n=1 Tax=Sphaerotilus hippei TaxID=744406 RepID=A0A318H658_9BURK|nr:sugar MFS transporter [Sphaerotilus hippei]PXW99464.1 FHS family L-fucose permease-like MFS transporter [Sphaerotilus hippei]
MAQQHGRPLAVLTSLFFMWGLITSLNDILIPHLKALFSLSYVEAMLVQFCFFMAYFVVSLPAGWLLQRLGYQRGLVVGLGTIGVGCLLFYPAAGAHAYPLFLGALFVLAAGVTLLQVAANPYVTLLGEPETASSRLNLTQAFNSLGATVGPMVGAVAILGAADHAVGAQADPSSVQGPYLVLAGLLFLLAVVVAWVRLPDPRRLVEAQQAELRGSAASADAGEQGSLWAHRHLVLGAVAIFAYVGAEVSIGSLLVNLMGEPAIAGLSAAEAGKWLSLYWGAAMVGRFIGSALMRKVSAARVLAAAGLVNAALIALAIAVSGPVAMWSLLAVGLFNSIMFPTIFALALEGLGALTSRGSGLLCMAIVGGAIVPLAQALLADHWGLLPSFAVPLVCYLYIAHYGGWGHQPAGPAVTEPAEPLRAPRAAAQGA